ncbi:hypothetical protein [Mycoplasma suis]|uniref:hypothetical protein n=1 Tax=Mycoplasma suis TaxID=57372 RepID=UPI001F23D4A4|nr:hypothetical protein [Mycoplasma suis]
MFCREESCCSGWLFWFDLRSFSKNFFSERKTVLNPWNISVIQLFTISNFEDIFSKRFPNDCVSACTTGSEEVVVGANHPTKVSKALLICRDIWPLFIYSDPATLTNMPPPR